MFYVAYNKRSSVTARAIAEHFNGRIINRKGFKRKPSVLIRWGNSYKEAPDGCVEINSIEACRNASDKLKMARLLSSHENVPFPSVYFFDEVTPENGIELYYRNKFGSVRKRNYYVDGDLYATAPIDTAREFRVHVFDGRIMGVYEKIPIGEEKPDYFKSDTCNFKRLDMANKEVVKEIKGVRPAAKAATEAVGLLFGGVDVIMDTQGKVFVNEVNSAPSLNTENVVRFCNEVKQYLYVRNSE